MSTTTPSQLVTATAHSSLGQLASTSIVNASLFRPHGSATRGIDLSPQSTLFEGRFGRIFRALPPADYGANDAESMDLLGKLAKAMVAPPDATKDGPDGEESGLPALYTYFGQFIDHDLTFDPASSLQRQNDPDALTDFRTPAFDLDSVYGRGIDDQPYLYESDASFVQGSALTGAALGTAIANAHDLPRHNPNKPATQRRAIIGDPRNDENVIVSQLQGLVHRFHNRLMADKGLSFIAAQRLTRFHYQFVVANDFLRKIVRADVYNAILPHVSANSNVIATPPKLRWYDPHNCPFMPLEFSAAAYRFGHSMIRPGYRLNDANIQAIFQYPGSTKPGPGLQGFAMVQPTWAIDWSRFIDLDGRLPGDETKPESDPGNQQRLQLAYRIDPSLTSPLATLPSRVVAPPDIIVSLAQRNLLRGWRMRLPSGQSVARAIGVKPLDESKIKIGKAASGEVSKTFASLASDPAFAGLDQFQGNCPLWTYVLVEAGFDDSVPRATLSFRINGGTKSIDTPQLGPVGGTIVAETFAGILLGDPNSFWNVDPLWTPNYKEGTVTFGSNFGLREFVAYALGRGDITI